MAADDESVPIQAYVPGHQLEVWRAEADSLDLSDSEYVRMMVQAGRDRFEHPALDGEVTHTPSSSTVGSDHESLKQQILEAIAAEGPLEWDGLLEALTNDIESALDAALDELQDENRVKHSGREGGYMLAGDRNEQ